MADVAKLAQVSASTVSHVINNTATISDATRERVRVAIDQLNYSPNLVARSLRHDSSHLICIALNDITSEFYSACIKTIIEAAQKRSFNVVICEASENIDKFTGSIQNLIDNQVDGFVFLGGHNSDAPVLERIKRAKVPLVICDRKMPGVSSVEFNNEESYYRMVCELYDSGYRNFMYVGESLDIQANLLDRYNGYLKGLKKFGLNNRQDTFRKDLYRFKMSVSYKLFDELFDRAFIEKDEPKVIVTSNDMIAHGIISAAIGRGIAVPDGLAVVGCDDINFSSCYHPTLTTIHQDAEALGKNAVKLLLNKEKEPQRIILKQELVVRESAKILPEIHEKYNDYFRKQHIVP